VEQGKCGVVDRLRLEDQARQEPQPIHHVPVVPRHHPLGQARGAGRVHEDEDVVLVELHGRLRGGQACIVGCLQVEHARRRRVACRRFQGVDDDGLHLGGLLRDAPVQVHEVVVHHEEFRVAVVDDEGQAVTLERRVDGVDVHADLLDAEEHVQKLGRVVHEHRHTVAGLGAQAQEIMGEPVRVPVGFAVRDGAVLVNHVEKAALRPRRCLLLQDRYPG